MRTFGIELEITIPAGKTREQLAQAIRAAGVTCYTEVYNHQTRSHWKIVTDSSIGYQNGEIVSPVLSGEAGMAQAKIVCEVADRFGCSANKKCGMHVHIDANGLGLAGFKRLAKSYQKFELAIDSIMPPSRRGNRGTFGGKTLQGKSIDSATSLSMLRSNLGGRYVKVNVDAYFRHGTVEFRQHSGTCQFSKVSNWVKLCLAFVESASRPEAAQAGAIDTASLQGATRICVELACRPEGCTTADVRAATGWAETGGFHNACRRAGLTLRKVREGRRIRYFAEQASQATSLASALPSLQGMADYLGLDADTRAYLAQRAAQVAA